MILVSGGAGVMGSRMVRGLVEAGCKVRIITLPGDPLVSRLDGLGVEIHYGDVSKAETLKGAFDGVDTVYHLAAVLISRDPSVFERVNVGGTRNMMEGAIAAGAKHFVFVSSISVTYPYTTPYSLSKVEGEKIVTGQNKVAWTIVRPTLAYNEYGGEEFMMFYQSLLKYPLVVPFIGFGSAKKKPVHVDDLMRGFLAIRDNPKSRGKIYAFCGGEEITMWQMGKLMLEHKGIRKMFIPVPVWLCWVLASLMDMIMKKPPLTPNAIAGVTQDANPDCSNATEDLGYRPVGFREGMRKCFPAKG